MPDFIYTVVITTDTQEHADTAMAYRLGFDDEDINADVPFDYRLEWSSDHREEPVTQEMVYCRHCGVPIVKDEEGEWWHDAVCPEGSPCWQGGQGPEPEEGA